MTRFHFGPARFVPNLAETQVGVCLLMGMNLGCIYYLPMALHRCTAKCACYTFCVFIILLLCCAKRTRRIDQHEALPSFTAAVAAKPFLKPNHLLNQHSSCTPPHASLE